MANPNRVIANSARKMSLQVEKVLSSDYLAQLEAEELRKTGLYDKVIVRRFRCGPRGNSYYNYALRAYVK